MTLLHMVALCPVLVGNRSQYGCRTTWALCACREAGISGHLVVATDLFTTTTGQRMALHLTNLLTAVASQPQAQLSSISLMATEEQQLVLHTFNDTAGPAPTLCVHQYFERQAAAAPQVVCLIDSVTGSSLTYAEVNSAANRLARHLASTGVAADVPVAVFMDKCLEAYIALVAILKAGGEHATLAAAAHCTHIVGCALCY
jgi:non-ribosomal peptide synthetase component F